MSNPWKSTKGAGQIWNPTKDAEGNEIMEAQEDDFLDGFYVDRRDGIGEHNSSVYTFETEEGIRWDVWGSTILNTELSKIRMGTMCRIQWHGKKVKKASQNKKTNQLKSTDYYHDWEVFTNTEVAPLDLGGGSQRPAENKTSSSTSNQNTGAQKTTGGPAKVDPKNGTTVEDDLPF